MAVFLQYNPSSIEVKTKSNDFSFGFSKNDKLPHKAVKQKSVASNSSLLFKLFTTSVWAG